MIKTIPFSYGCRRDFSKLMQVPLPDLGEGTKEATVKEWFVKPGDTVKEVSKFSVTFLFKFFMNFVILNFELY